MPRLISLTLSVLLEMLRSNEMDVDVLIETNGRTTSVKDSLKFAYRISDNRWHIRTRWNQPIQAIILTTAEPVEVVESE